MKRQEDISLFFSFSLLMLSVLFMQEVCAETGSLTLEKEQHWETYRVGGACIPGGHNLFLKDIDGDGLIEIIAGGFAYQLVEEKIIAPATSLTIWNWNGKNLTLGKNYQWNTTVTTSISCVYAADANGDGNTEILTGGRFRNGSMNFAQLRVWSWNGINLVLESSTELTDLKGASVSSIFVSDLDNDGKPEIITCGRIYNDTKSNAQLRIWHLNANGLVQKKSVEWCAAKEASANSVYASDVNGDGVTEIITCGFDHDLENSTGQLRLWKWNGTALTMAENQEWRMTEGYMLNVAGNVMGNTIANVVKAGDVDGDGFPEIATGGFTYDGTHANAQVVIWRWNGENLIKVGSCDWHTQDINEVKSMSIEDVDGDGKQEIVTSGFVGNAIVWPEPSHSLGQLRVWSWDGKTLALKNSQDWTIEDSACAWNVGTGDVDNDGVTEIITVGCIYIATLCDPDMRIWSIPQEPTSIPYALWAVVATGAVILVVGAFLFVRKNWK